MNDNEQPSCTVALTGALQDDGSVQYDGFCIARDTVGDFDRGRFLLQMNRWQAGDRKSGKAVTFARGWHSSGCHLQDLLENTGGRARNLIDYVTWGWASTIRMACLLIDGSWVGWDCLAAGEASARHDSATRINELSERTAVTARELDGLTDGAAVGQGEIRYRAQQTFAEIHGELAVEIARLAVHPDVRVARITYSHALEAARQRAVLLAGAGAVSGYSPRSAWKLHWALTGVANLLARYAEFCDRARRGLPGSPVWAESGDAAIALLQDATESTTAALPHLRSASDAAARSITLSDREGPRVGQRLRAVARERAEVAATMLEAAYGSAHATGIAPDAARLLLDSSHAAMQARAERRIEVLREVTKRAVTLTEAGAAFMKLELLAAQVACRATVQNRS